MLHFLQMSNTFTVSNLVLMSVFLFLLLFVMYFRLMKSGRSPPEVRASFINYVQRILNPAINITRNADQVWPKLYIGDM